MKERLLVTLQKILAFLSKKILNKYKPEVIAITGSVGKTSTKEAIYSVLASTYNVRTNYKNYNNELGIPLTIIGSAAGGRSLWRWLVVFLNALRLIVIRDKKYPNILVLEMGADHPGDIKYLTSLVPINVAVVTAVAPVHLEFFETIDMVAKEKTNLVRALSKNGYAVLNLDDALVAVMAEKTNAKIVTYGLDTGADVKATEIAVSHEIDYKDYSTIQGISFKLQYQGSTVPVLLPRVLGKHLAYSALAAIAVGLIYDLNLHEITEALKKYEPPKGRMHIIPGIKNTLIIDDTYNSSPLAVKKALEQVESINLAAGHKKFAVLGDMLELGKISTSAHREIGRAVFDNKIDYLFTVGELSRDTIRAAILKGMPKDRCFSFSDSASAGRFLQDKLSEGDLVLVKGSQGMRMEKIVKEIMAEPNRAKDLLVRQEKEWN